MKGEFIIIKTRKINNFLIKNVNWKLLILIFLFQFLPTIYKTTRIFFLGSLPDENSFNIASQILWLGVLYEVITESIVMPIFYLFSKWKLEKDYKNKFTYITIFVFIFYLIFTIIIFFSVEVILKSSLNIDNSIFEQSKNYIKLEVWGFLFYSFFSYLFITTTIFKFEKYISVNLIVCIMYTFLSCILDLFLITDFSFSLNLSVNGIAINSIITNSICSLVFLCYLSNKNIRIWDFNFSNIHLSKWKQEYFKLLFISSIEVLVRNAAFYLMVIKPINSLNDQGVYWVTNNFIWSWLLLPISTLGTYIKETFILNDERYSFKNQLLFYFSFVTLIIFIWFIFSPLNELFIKNILGAKKDYLQITKLTFLLLPFYLFFSYGVIIDSIFIKEGKINFYCIQSLIVNLTVYPIYFILWKANIWIPNLESISVMFGLGMVVHFFVDVILFYYFVKKKKIIKKSIIKI